MACVTNPLSFLKQCSAYGLSFECTPSWNTHASNTDLIYWGQLTNGVVMILIGMYNALVYLDALPKLKMTPVVIKEKDDAKVKTMPKWATLTLAVYAIGTGFFALVRLHFHVSRPLLILAALHNLCEWAFVIMWYVPKVDEKGRKFFMAFAAVWSIIVLVTVLPILPYGGALEQVHGLILDYTIPYTHYKLYTNEDPRVSRETKAMWGWALIASGIHISLTILPIIVMNFFVLQNETFDAVMEVGLFISAIVTMVAYTKFVSIWDASWFDDEGENKPGYLAHNFLQRAGVGLILGVVTLAGPLVVFSFCEVGSGGLTPISSTAEMHIAVVTVKPGSEEFWMSRFNREKLVESARGTAGCLRYDMYQNAMKSNEFSAVQVWNSHEEFMAFETGPVVKRVFDATSRKLITNFDYGEFYTPIDLGQTPTTQDGAISFVIENSCTNVWSMVGDWKNCNWYVGCDTVSVSGMNSTRTMYMKDGREIKQTLLSVVDSEMRMVYVEHLEQERTVTVSLSDFPGKCSVVSTVEIMSADPLHLDAYVKAMYGGEIDLLKANLMKSS